MPRPNNLRPHLDGALHDRFEIVYLKPKQHAVSVWPVVRIADPAVMMLHGEAVQLEHKLPVRDQLFIGGTSMITPAAKQTLVPPAARLNIGYGDQRLSTHFASLTDSLGRVCGAYFGMTPRPAIEHRQSIRNLERSFRAICI